MTNIDSHIQRLYEDERLTGGLTDDDAKLLLTWAEGQLREAAHHDPAQLDSIARQVRRLLRSINTLVGQRSSLSDTRMIQQLLRLVELSSQLAHQTAAPNNPAITNPQETSRGQET